MEIPEYESMRWIKQHITVRSRKYMKYPMEVHSNGGLTDEEEDVDCEDSNNIAEGNENSFFGCDLSNGKLIYF